MPKPWEDYKLVRTKFRLGGLVSHICWLLGVIFAILGIIADAMNGTLGLDAISWFLLAIGLFAASIAPQIGWAVSWYLETTEAKKEEEYAGAGE